MTTDSRVECCLSSEILVDRFAQHRSRCSPDSIKVAGFDGDGPNLELIRQGDVQAADLTTGGDEPGWVAADAAARVIAGEPVETTTPVTKLLVVDANASDIGDTYKGPEGFEEQFKSLWGQ